MATALEVAMVVAAAATEVVATEVAAATVEDSLEEEIGVSEQCIITKLNH